MASPNPSQNVSPEQRRIDPEKASASPRPGRPDRPDRPDLSALRLDHDAVPARRRRGWWWLVGAVLLVGVGVAAARLPLPWLVPTVQATTVQAQTQAQAQTVLTATGYTYARTRAAVGAKIIGRVVELRVDEGDRIRKGDVIVVLDSEDLRAAERRAQAAVLEAQARLADAEREAARQGRMAAAGIAPQSDLDAAQTRLEVARAQVETARAQLDSVRAQLDYTVVRSPVDGVVIERQVEVGEMVAPGGFTTQQSTGAIVRIADPESLEVEADINESYISRLRLGQPATIKVDAVPDRTYRGSLRQIVPTADRQRAVVEVKVTIEDHDERLVPDMSCTVVFLEQELDRAALDAAPLLFVPKTALLAEGGDHFLLRIEDGRLQKRLVTLGGGQGELVEVTGGLSGGDAIVAVARPGLEDGQRVKIGS